MKQGILITAYKHWSHLLDIIDFFDDGFEIYIHIDKKRIPAADTLTRIGSSPKVRFLDHTYNVNWGGRNHLLSILRLSERAVANKDLSHMHLISGQDFPARSLEAFKQFPLQHPQQDFLQHVPLPTPEWTGGGMRRLEYYNLYDVLDGTRHKKWIERLVTLQEKLGWKRLLSPGIGQLYGGNTWWTLSRETLEYVVRYTREQPYLINRLKHTFCSEEVYVPTVVMNSPFAGRVLNKSLRYVDWSLRNGAYPATLDATDWDAIRASGNLFARKFDTPVSDGLKQLLVNQK